MFVLVGMHLKACNCDGFGGEADSGSWQRKLGWGGRVCCEFPGHVLLALGSMHIQYCDYVTVVASAELLS